MKVRGSIGIDKFWKTYRYDPTILLHFIPTWFMFYLCLKSCRKINKIPKLRPMDEMLNLKPIDEINVVRK